MKKTMTPEQSEYEAAVEKLRKFCEDHTDLTPCILDKSYPFRVQFIPDDQPPSLTTRTSTKMARSAT